MFLTAEIRKIDGTSLGVLVLNRKEFKSGRQGWHGQGKLTIDGKRHQVQVQAVEIRQVLEREKVATGGPSGPG